MRSKHTTRNAIVTNVKQERKKKLGSRKGIRRDPKKHVAKDKLHIVEVTEEEYQSSDKSCIYMYEFVVYIICKGLYSSCIQYLIHSTHFSHAILVGCER